MNSEKVISKNPRSYERGFLAVTNHYDATLFFEKRAAPKILCKSHFPDKQIISGLQCSQTEGLVSYYYFFLFAECYACVA